MIERACEVCHEPIRDEGQWRPTETKGIAMGAVQFLTAMGLFIGQPKAFFELLQDLGS